MTLKVRLAAMMIALLVAVMAAQYLLMQREQRDLARRLDGLSREIDESTRRFSERSRFLAAASDSSEIEAIVEWIQGTRPGLPDFVEEIDGNYVFVHEDDSTKIEIRAFGGKPGEVRRVVREERLVPAERGEEVGSLCDDSTAVRVVFAGHRDLTEGAPGDAKNVEILKINLPLPGRDDAPGRSVQLHYSMNSLTEELARARRRSWGWLVGLLGVGAAGALLVAVQFTRPIRSLQSSFGRVVEGDLDVAVEPERADEIGSLTSSFNEMVAQLRETRVMEQRLGEAERLAAVGRLAAGVAHEVRNPLNAMMLTMQQLSDKTAPAPGTPERERFDRYTRMVVGELSRLERLVGTFLDLSRPGRAALESVNVGDSLRAAVDLFAPQAEGQGVSLVVEVAEPIVIEGDPERLPTVWNNLVSNALQAARRGGKIIARARAIEEGAMVEIVDDGQGIESEKLPHVWEPFFSGRADGTGLGLSLVRSIVEAHGGSTEAESVAGDGTTIRVLLPRAGRMEESS